jgi:dihydrofolate reductase
MRKIINSTYISLDGVIERPHEWPSVGPRGDKGEEIVNELLLSCDALIMGRRTYEGFAPVWPTRSGDPASDHINSMAKYVVSSTLTDPEWNNTSVLAGDPVAEIKALKEAPGKDIVQYGFGQLSHTLMEHGCSTSCACGSTRCSSGRPSRASSSIATAPAQCSTSSTRRASRTAS